MESRRIERDRKREHYLANDVAGGAVVADEEVVVATDGQTATDVLGGGPHDLDKKRVSVAAEDKKGRENTPECSGRTAGSWCSRSWCHSCSTDYKSRASQTRAK